MIYATVEFPEDRKQLVDLRDGGWRLRKVLAPELEGLLDRIASPGAFGPADGDPVARAADAAAEFLGGAVTFVRHPDPVPLDSEF